MPNLQTIPRKYRVRPGSLAVSGFNGTQVVERNSPRQQLEDMDVIL